MNNSILGVSWCKGVQKWLVRVSCVDSNNKKISYKESFTDLDEAVCTRLAYDYEFGNPYYSILENSAYVYVQEKILGNVVDKTVNQVYLKQIFNYKDGYLYFKVSPIIGRNRNETNILAGTLNKTDGRWYIKINHKRYSAHYLIWLFHKGTKPVYELDHSDRIKSNNRIENLRDIPTSDNCINKSKKSTNTTGITGVECSRRLKGNTVSWFARVTCYKTATRKRIKLGTSRDFNSVVLLRITGEVLAGYYTTTNDTTALQYARDNNLIDVDRMLAALDRHEIACKSYH